MTGGLGGILRDGSLVWSSWMEQKGVDGFCLSVSSFLYSRAKTDGLLWRRHGGGLRHTCTTNKESRQHGLTVLEAIFSCGKYRSEKVGGGKSGREIWRRREINGLSVLVNIFLFSEPPFAHSLFSRNCSQQSVGQKKKAKSLLDPKQMFSLNVVL